jgi:hypothetical protein
MEQRAGRLKVERQRIGRRAKRMAKAGKNRRQKEEVGGRRSDIRRQKTEI